MEAPNSYYISRPCIAFSVLICLAFTGELRLYPVSVKTQSGTKMELQVSSIFLFFFPLNTIVSHLSMSFQGFSSQIPLHFPAAFLIYLLERVTQSVQWICFAVEPWRLSDGYKAVPP